ncbi:MAG: hypothetical protein HYX67_05015 [Candidatus Melainabacteria bacterium]|nr:hypothetical protein [Candidatus Melainabacteria bacterium]
MADNNRDFRDATRHAHDASRDAQQAGQNIVNFAADVWSMGASGIRGGAHSVAETARNTTHAGLEAARGAGHNVMNGVREFNSETSDIQHNIQGAGHVVMAPDTWRWKLDGQLDTQLCKLNVPMNNVSKILTVLDQELPTHQDM